MLCSLVLLAGLLVACRVATAPDSVANGPPDFRGMITFLADDGPAPF